MERVEVKTKAAAEKAVKAGKPVRIVAGTFALAFTGLAVDIDVAPSANVSISLTDCGTWDAPSTARGSSRVEAWGSSSVVARGSSSVEAWESSSVVARGYVTLQLHGGSVTAKASPTVFSNLWNDATCDGGQQQVVNLSTPADWCEYYGARIEDDNAVVYKAVGEDYSSRWGVTYTPGTRPEDPAWDGKGAECAKGGGLNFSPTPRHTHQFVNDPKHYLECRVTLDEMVVHFDGLFPQKCCAPRVVAPLIEVDVEGNPLT